MASKDCQPVDITADARVARPVQSGGRMSFDAMREQTLQRFTIRVFRLRVHVLLPVVALVFTPLLAMDIEPWRARALIVVPFVLAVFFVWDARRVRHLRVDDAFFRTYVPMILSVQSVLIALTGGLTSPLLPVFLPVMWVAGTGLQRWRDVLAIPALGAAVLACMAVGHATGWLVPVPGLWPGPPTTLWLIMAPSVLAAVSLVTASLSHHVALSYEEIDRSLERARCEAVEVHHERLRTVEGMSRRVAHEIRNPLAAIKGLTQLLQRRGDPTGHLAVIAGEVERLQGILDGFLTFSRPLDDLKQQACDVGALVLDVCAILEARLDQAGVTLALEVGRPAPVTGDPGRLKQVLMNLMLNAVEAMERAGTPDRRLAVTVHTADGRVVIRVRDTGPGIDPAQAERAFEPSVSDKPDGAGLGLPISRSIVRAHGGELRLARADGGAEALVELPAPTTNTETP